MSLLDEGNVTESTGIPARQEADHDVRTKAVEVDPCFEITQNQSQQIDKMCMFSECLQTGMYVSTSNFSQNLITSAV